jgi:hypothetical protein
MARETIHDLPATDAKGVRLADIEWLAATFGAKGGYWIVEKQGVSNTGRIVANELCGRLLDAHEPRQRTCRKGRGARGPQGRTLCASSAMTYAR